MSSFEEFVGLEPTDVRRQTIVLTLLCVMVFVAQLIIILALKLFHPSIVGQNTTQTLAHTTREFKKMADCVLLDEKNKKHQESIRDWLSITTLNANNYSEVERNANNPVDAIVDERNAIIMTFDSQALIPSEDVIRQGGSQVPPSYQTPMMKIINHQVRIIFVVGKLKQLNLGMSMSEETELRKKGLPWRGVVDVLGTIVDKPRFPSALDFSVVRALKDKKDWNYAEMGTRLDPQTLSEKPWPGIRLQANSYMNSFLVDVFLYWFQIWFSLVLAQIIFS
jgi:hypothetical protein